jgi:hypothetical protein
MLSGHEWVLAILFFATLISTIWGHFMDNRATRAEQELEKIRGQKTVDKILVDSKQKVENESLSDMVRDSNTRYSGKGSRSDNS